MSVGPEPLKQITILFLDTLPSQREKQQKKKIKNTRRVARTRVKKVRSEFSTETENGVEDKD